jgi:hypothetical protein
VHGGIDSPKVSESCAIVGALEDKVVDEGSLVDEPVDEELDFIEDTDVILFVLNLEVAVGGCAILHINHILAIDESLNLFIVGRTSPSSGVDHIIVDNLVVRGRVGSGNERKRAGDLVGIRGGIVDHTWVSTDINGVSGALFKSGEKTSRSHSVGASTLE